VERPLRIGVIGGSECDAETAEVARLMDDPAEIDQVLADGAARAREIAAPIVKRTYEIVGLTT